MVGEHLTAFGFGREKHAADPEGVHGAQGHTIDCQLILLSHLCFMIRGHWSGTFLEVLKGCVCEGMWEHSAAKQASSLYPMNRFSASVNSLTPVERVVETIGFDGDPLQFLQFGQLVRNR